MGNCGSSGTAAIEQRPSNRPSKQSSPQAFQGTGHRLGAANEQQQQSALPLPVNEPDAQAAAVLPNIPPKDSTLSESERQRQREVRLAAVEKRQQKYPKTTKKKKSSAPLKGPNSEPLMRWQAG